MNKILLLILTAITLLLVFTTASIMEQEYVYLEIYYKDGNFTLLNKTLEKGNYPTISHDPNFTHTLNLLSGQGQGLYNYHFNPTIINIRCISN